MDNDTVKPKPLHPLMALLLAIAALCLWVPLLLLLLIFSSHDGGETAFYGAVAILGICVVVWPVGAVLLILYALMDKVWRRPFRRAWFFWLQAVVVLMVGAKVASYFFGDWQAQRRQAVEQTRVDQAGSYQQTMQVALLTDDVNAFSAAYKVCGDYCSPLPWLRKAITAQAPHILSVLLEGETPQSYAQDFHKADEGGLCRDGTYYAGYYSLAGQAGAVGNPTIIERLLPLWSRDDVQEAFVGAAFGNHVETMQALMARGADPHPPINEDPVGDAPVNDAITAAMGSGALDALRWLATQGARPGSDGEQNLIWVKFGEWVEATPPEVWTKQLEPMLDALKKVGVVASHNASEPLWHAVDTENSVLVHALLSHGALATDLSEDADRQAKLKALLAGPADQLGHAGEGKVRSCSGSLVD